MNILTDTGLTIAPQSSEMELTRANIGDSVPRRIMSMEDLLSLPMMDYTEEVPSATHRALQRLEIAYEYVVSGSESSHMFSDVVSSINWSCMSVEVFETAIDLALELNVVVVARRLANYGLQYHPHSDHLRRAAHVLAPPKIVEAGKPARMGLAEFTQWFKENAHSYRGSWVAVQSGTLLYSANSRAKLIEHLNSLDIPITTSDLVISRVP